jgi:hypothetical protein
MALEPAVLCRVFERDGVRVVCDDLSLEFLRGAIVDYESDLMRSAFVVRREGLQAGYSLPLLPNTVAACLSGQSGYPYLCTQQCKL